MAIRLSGMVSGLDTDSVVQALMSAQKYKKTKIEQNKQKLEWKQELWSEMNSKIYNFYKSSLSKIKMQSTYKTKNAASSDSSKLTATAGAGATTGTYRVKVNNVASAQYVTSGALQSDQSGNAVTNSTKLTDLNGTGIAAGTQIKITAENGDKTTYLNVDSDTTVADFVTAAKSVGLNASFDEAQQRFFIGSSTSGEKQKFTITASTLDAAQVQAVSDWKDAIGYSKLSASDQQAVTGIFNDLQSGTKTYTDVEDSLKTYLSNARGNAITDYYKEQITAKMYTDSSQTTLSSLGQAVLGKTSEEIAAMSADDIKSAVNAAVNNAMSSDEVKNAISADKESGVHGSTVTIDGVAVGIDASSDSFLSASRTSLETSLASVASNYNATMSTGATENNVALNKLGLSAVTGDAVAENLSAADGGMVVVKAQDAKITLNGATLTSSDSTLTVNGLTLNILEETGDKEVTVTVTKDTSAVYDAVKDFISEYNSVLKAMNTSYNADTARGYNVLTSDQKEEMTDDEIEKWENKIKSSLLRRDDTLSSLISSFRNNMMNSYTASDGKRYSLASIGISTSTDYTEKGLLHIKGDEDDDVYADQTNILQQKLEEDPDLVMEILSGLTNNLYQDLTKKMSSNSMSSALTFYNDKQMTKQMTQYKKDISKWEVKLADLEDRYYKQFTAMEKALANSQSQSSSLSGFFG